MDLRTMADLAVLDPNRVGRFELRGVLGKGAQATVWLAHDPRLDREVAVKLMHADAGLSTGPPEGRRCTPANDVAICRSESRTWPLPEASTSDRPGSRGTPKYSWIRGRRKSALITSVLRPASASTAAR